MSDSDSRGMRAFLDEVLDGLAVDYADIRVEESERSSVLYRGERLDSIGRSFERGGCLRVFDRGNWVVATFNAIDESLVGLAEDLARQAEELPPRESAPARLGPHEETVRLDPAQDPRTVSLADKRMLIHHYNSILTSTPGIVSTVAQYRDEHRFTVFLSSEGRFLDQERADCGFHVRAVARDGSNIQDYGDGFGKPQGFAALLHREALVERVGKVALDLLRAEPVAAGRYTVIVDPLLAAVFCHEAFGHLAEADHVVDNERLREMMRPGTPFGVEELSIVDDATMPGERGSYRYDDEGVPAGRTELIRQGRLVGLLHDRSSAGQMAAPPTGNGRALSCHFPPVVRMSNTFIEPREADVDEMLDKTERGLYICGSRGGMTELESFTFSAQYAWLVESGRKRRLVRDVTLAGNVFETMSHITDIGDDLVLFGGLGGCGKAGQGPLPVGLGAPHLRISDVVVGGR
ncbi:MAG TPA: TldD/PmbA family protein [candidate division WOR-3 bacterium]|uniref:TldD/PmbA family protein n=1 Tax=candidate division WOR-3 bacterium TaxID=2052148 RepID=A0A7V0T569_UNCW3|nr:TldD/PmbA family protein [candidate division WOR-3 bacterium]